MKENVHLDTEYNEYKNQTKSEIERLNEKYDNDMNDMINKFELYKNNLDNIEIKPKEDELSPLLIQELRIQLNHYKDQVKDLSESKELLKNQNNVLLLSNKTKEESLLKTIETEKYNSKTMVISEYQNKSILKIQPINTISGPNTERFIQNNNNYSLSNIDGKSNNINDSIFINVNDSSNSLQNYSKFKKIKVNTIKKQRKVQKLSFLNSNINNKTNSYWKIHKKSKNTCIINSFNNNNKEIKNEENNHNYISVGGKSEKII